METSGTTSSYKNLLSYVKRHVHRSDVQRVHVPAACLPKIILHMQDAIAENTVCMCTYFQI